MSPVQPDLFSQAPPTLPQGLAYQPDLLSPREQEEMVGRLRTLPFEPFDFHGYKGNRRIVSYGVRYDYSREAVTPVEPIPDFLLAARLAAASFAGLDPEVFGHALITQYAPGAGIGWHLDKAVFGEVVGLSFASPCTLRFRRVRAEGGWERCGAPLAPGSVYLLKGPARTLWEHSIAPVDQLRYSVTFRRYVIGEASPSAGAGAGG